MSDLVRPTQGRVFGGVCAALAVRFAMNVSTVRVLTVVAALLGAPLVVYVVLWIVIPSA